MKNFRLFIAMTIMILLIPMQKYLSQNQQYVIIGTILFLFLLNLLLRGRLRFKPYFTSPLNLFIVRESKTIELGIDPQMAMEHVKEVIAESSFKLRETDEKTGELLATAGMSWTTWGENLYVTITPDNGGSKIEVMSAGIFGIFDNRKNEDNVREISDELEKSLIV